MDNKKHNLYKRIKELSDKYCDKNNKEIVDEIDQTSSWAVWATPQKAWNKAKDNISIKCLSEEEIISQVNGSFMLVSLNPSNKSKHPDKDKNNIERITPWASFHSGLGRSKDYKLRYALYGTEYWGAFITDLFPGLDETVTSEYEDWISIHSEQAIERVFNIRDKMKTQPTIIAIGDDVYEILSDVCWKKGVNIKKISHFSRRYVGHSQYRSLILEQQLMTHRSFSVTDIEKILSLIDEESVDSCSKEIIRRIKLCKDLPII